MMEGRNRRAGESAHVVLSDVGEFGERILTTDTGGPCFGSDDSFELLGLQSGLLDSSNLVRLLGPNVAAIQDIISRDEEDQQDGHGHRSYDQ